MKGENQMKKILAMLLALMMALSCALAAAEEAAAPAIPSFTLECETEINEEALMKLLPKIGIDESQLPIVQNLLPILANLSEKLVIADNGAQLDLMLKGTPVATLAAKANDTGLEAVTNLLPSYKITLQKETLENLLQNMGLNNGEVPSFDAEALSAEIMGIVAKYSEMFVSTITPGTPEQGAFEYDGCEFNTKVPFDVDTRALLTAVMNMIKEIMSNEAMQNALAAVPNANLDLSKIDEAIAKLESASDDEIPDVAVTQYFNADENGETTDSLQWSNVIVDSKSEDTGIVDTNVLTDGTVVKVNVNIEKQDVNVTVYVNPEDMGELLQLDVEAKGEYFGLDVSVAQEEDVTSIGLYVYVEDRESALLAEIITFYKGGELTASFDEEGKTVLAIEDALQDQEGTVLNALLTDLQTNGLMAVIGNAMQVMPQEINGLMTMFMGGAQQEVPAEEAAPAVNE